MEQGSRVTDDKVREASRLGDELAARLYGIGPDLQGAVIVQLAAIWLAGHAPEYRALMLANFNEMALELAAHYQPGIFNVQPPQG